MILSRLDELIKLAKNYTENGYKPMDAIKLAERALENKERETKLEELEENNEIQKRQR